MVKTCVRPGCGHDGYQGHFTMGGPCKTKECRCVAYMAADSRAVIRLGSVRSSQA